MADISKITLPNGSTYDIKDTTARSQITSEANTRKAADDSINNTINNLKTSLTGAMHYVGVTTTALHDGDYTKNPISPIKIDNADYVPKAGDVVIYQNKEFVYSIQIKYETGPDGTIEKEVGIWNEFGSTGSLKALAFKDNATGDITPSGTVSKPTFTGASSNVTFYTSSDKEGSESIILPTEVSSLTASPASYVNNEWDYPDVGEDKSVSCNLKAVVTGGSVNTTATKATIKQVSNVGTLPSFTASVTGETLSFEFNAGSLPTTSDASVVTGVSSTHTNPKVDVSPFTFGISFKNDNISAKVTPQGSVSQPTFTGNTSTVTVK